MFHKNNIVMKNPRRNVNKPSIHYGGVSNAKTGESVPEAGQTSAGPEGEQPLHEARQPLHEAGQTSAVPEGEQISAVPEARQPSNADPKARQPSNAVPEGEQPVNRNNILQIPHNMSDQGQQPDQTLNNVVNADIKRMEKLNEIKKEKMQEEEEKLEELYYGKIVTISLYISAWILSCVLLYTYNSKRASLLKYNKTMRDINTKKLNDQIIKYNTICQQYASAAYPVESMVGNVEPDTSGVNTIRKKMYKELIKTVDLYEKCNYIKLNTKGAPFPMSEIMISGILLLVVLSIIIVSNLSNNPFQKLTIGSEIDEISNMISSSLNVVNTDMEASVQQMKGGSSVNNVRFDDVLEDLVAKEVAIKKKISFLKGDSKFNYVSLSFCIILFSFYLSFKMMMSTSSFSENLYSGSTFMKSRCYDI